MIRDGTKFLISGFGPLPRHGSLLDYRRIAYRFPLPAGA
jgi:hypothetical protein